MSAKDDLRRQNTAHDDYERVRQTLTAPAPKTSKERRDAFLGLLFNVRRLIFGFACLVWAALIAQSLSGVLAGSSLELFIGGFAGLAAFLVFPSWTVFRQAAKSPARKYMWGLLAVFFYNLYSGLTVVFNIPIIPDSDVFLVVYALPYTLAGFTVWCLVLDHYAEYSAMYREFKRKVLAVYNWPWED